MPNVSEYYSRPQGRTRWASFENPRAKKGTAAWENHGSKENPFDAIPSGGTVS